MPVCPGCQSTEIEWVPVSGDGTVFSYTVVHHPVHPALRDAVPYNVAVVLLDGAGDVRLVSNVIDRWVGYRVWAELVELWVGQPARIHDRALWTRSLTAVTGGFTAGPWRSTRLQP
jgi:uncharacterized OB-fold protein